MKKNAKIYLTVLFLVITIVFILFVSVKKKDVKKAYIILFKKDGVISHYNKNGKLDGEFCTYIDGKIHTEAYFFNGVTNGWVVRYYENGLVKSRIYYKDNKADGEETDYYSNGNLNYRVNWRNDRRYGSEYHFSIDKKLVNYDAFDLNSLFCYVEYNEAQNISKVQFEVFSDYIFSANGKSHSTIILNDNGKYKNIKDLYITVATPPKLSLKIKVNINKISFDNLKVDKNTIKIEDAFLDTGKYAIDIVGELIGSEKRVFKSKSFKRVIIKQ